MIRANIATIQWIAGDSEPAYAQAKIAIEMAEQLDYLPLTTFASFAIANLDHNYGHIRKCVDRLTYVANQFSGNRSAIRFGQTITIPGAMTRAFASWYTIDLGDVELAEQFEREARAIAEEQNHGYSKTLCDLALGYKFYRTDVYDKAAKILTRAYNACIEESFYGIAPMAAAWAGAALIGNGQAGLAKTIIDQELALDHISSVRNSGKYYLYSSQAKLLAKAGKLDSAFRVHQKALRSALDTKDPVSEAYARMEKADLLHRLNKPQRDIGLELEAALKLARQCEMALLIAKCENRLNEMKD